jgi:predicted transcriptional regulator
MAIKRTIELSADVDAALSAAAAAGSQTPSELVESALVRFLRDAAESAEDAERWARYLQTRKAVPIEAVRQWVASWDTDKERPAPTP